MFKVIATQDWVNRFSINDVLTVYSIENDDEGGTYFLIYSNGDWIWIAAECFRPA